MFVIISINNVRRKRSPRWRWWRRKESLMVVGVCPRKKPANATTSCWGGSITSLVKSRISTISSSSSSPSSAAFL